MPLVLPAGTLTQSHLHLVPQGVRASKLDLHPLLKGPWPMPSSAGEGPALNLADLLCGIPLLGAPTLWEASRRPFPHSQRLHLELQKDTLLWCYLCETPEERGALPRAEKQGRPLLPETQGPSCSLPTGGPKRGQWGQKGACSSFFVVY